MFEYMHEKRTEFNIFFLIIHVANFIYIYILGLDGLDEEFEKD